MILSLTGCTLQGQQVCSKCPFSVRSDHFMKKHEQAHSWGQKYICETCHAICPTTQLNTHESILGNALKFRKDI
ncbi:hypothetical protein JTE90_004548 [Oedothorax gibbosus]|uniref:C2H2-type domain-containing protein n=1 Tax=Oedothorax gibbosus TaxID=931172 RepID=A0AAV6VCD1_9ARAC|nr:hypothetical protein JTE90_004548 [Oedothorax gibbosus]